MGRKLRSAGWRVAVVLAVASCGSPPPPPPTIVNVTLRAATDVNPGPSGNAEPIAVRVYQLASAATFSGAEFYQLFDHDDETLKGDGAKHEEHVLAPGETAKVTISPDPNIKVLGFFGAYQAFQKAAWRKTWNIPPNRTTDLTINVGSAGITIAPAPAAR